jgi:hypothetical protein
MSCRTGFSAERGSFSDRTRRETKCFVIGNTRLPVPLPNVSQFCCTASPMTSD